MTAVATAERARARVYRVVVRRAGMVVARSIAALAFMVTAGFVLGLYAAFLWWVPVTADVVAGGLLEMAWNLIAPEAWVVHGWFQTAAIAASALLFLGFAVLMLLNDLSPGPALLEGSRFGHEWSEARFARPVTWQDHRYPRPEPQPAPSASAAQPAPAGASVTPSRLPAPPIIEPVPRAEPIVALRVWRVELDRAQDGEAGNPVLGSVTTSYRWESEEVAAVCGRGGGHRVPALDCSCGIYAVRMGTPVPPYARDGISAVGAVELSGRVLEATRGYRAERARIVGPLRVSLRCFGLGSEPEQIRLRAALRRLAPREWCPLPPVAVAFGGGGYTPMCAVHAEGGAVPAERIARQLMARLELRYGVEVTIEKEAPWT